MILPTTVPVIGTPHAEDGPGENTLSSLPHHQPIRMHMPQITVAPRWAFTPSGSPDGPCRANWSCPQDHYNVQFVLTEESFHQTGLGGFWAGAMMADNIHFFATIDAEADLDNDFDIDGADLAINVSNQLSVPLDVFAVQFGLTVCRR